MREVIAVCRSTKRARVRVSRILDRYFWRIGDRTWRGKASNACLGRISKELRKEATRNMAVTIHEIRSAHESRIPIVRIGAKHAFSETGIAPISSRPAQLTKSRSVSSNRPVVQIAALFHDLGKATCLFQNKLERAMNGGRPEADAIRHEVFSATVWSHLFGKCEDEELASALDDLTPEQVDAACDTVRDKLVQLVSSSRRKEDGAKLEFSFLEREGSLSHAIGMLVLTHHRLPESGSDIMTPLANYHVNSRYSGEFNLRDALKIADGTPFWHEKWWLDSIQRNADQLSDNPLVGLDLYLRGALMMGDHLGSSQKKRSSDERKGHLANTIKEDGHLHRADSLDQHVRRVCAASRHAVGLFERHAHGFPALDQGEMPVKIAYPIASKDPHLQRFRWQVEASEAARDLCNSSEGGFFGCLMAGTGTGKTRAAPTILAAAAFADTRPERQYFRMNLGLGLRVLASQSANEYSSELGFNAEDISVLIGQEPLAFKSVDDLEDAIDTGSESLIELPDWLRIEMATGKVPQPGDQDEEDWLRGLSLDTGKGLPAFCERILEATGKRAATGRKMLAHPIMVGTIDHLMSVAAPVNSRYLVPALRVATSDLILDEIDQFDGEDIAALGRLVYQTAAAGRRVIIMSATLTPDIASALHAAYSNGWTRFAAAHGLNEHVNLLITGDASGSCRTNTQGETLEALLEASTKKTLEALAKAPPARRAEILPDCENWEDLVAQIDESCTRLHNLNAVDIDDFRVSFGMVRMTRIRHTAALAAQISSGKTENFLRLKLCLHSQFPRLHREWIETRLKRALTRHFDPEDDPNFRLRELCHDECIFPRAEEMGVKNIQIVLVTSPVIETGNDLDFDWAILDPISTRSIIQSAGRVWRHRVVTGDQSNVLILGQSPVSMDDREGRLRMPGVETGMNKDTRVSAPNLEDIIPDLKGTGERPFRKLAGEADFSVINAAPILDRDTDFPLRDAESDLRQKLVAAECDTSEQPLGRYIERVSARMTRGVFRKRKFRRSDRQVIPVALIGEDFETAEWHRDLAPGTHYSKFEPMDNDKFDECEVEGSHLFDRLTERAWEDLQQQRRSRDENPSFYDVKRLMCVEIPERDLEREPELTYTQFTGFTRGSFDDLFRPFGKTV